MAPAWGAEVVSSNIVGYEKINLANPLTMTGAQFRQVGATATTDLLLSQITLDGVTGMDAEWNFGAALLIWNGKNYVGGQYYWVGPDMESEVGGKWSDDAWEVADDVVLPAGTAFWIQDNNRSATSVGTITVAGEVVQGTTPDPAEIKHPLTMIANPYPQAFKLKDLVVEGTLTGMDAEWNFGAGLLVWNGKNYVGGQYYWVGPDMESEVGGKWSDDAWEVADDVEIPVGGAFWIQDNAYTGTAKISFPAPAAE